MATMLGIRFYPVTIYVRLSFSMSKNLEHHICLLLLLLFLAYLNDGAYLP